MNLLKIQGDDRITELYNAKLSSFQAKMVTNQQNTKNHKKRYHNMIAYYPI